jgi:hypothetical protein
MNRKVPKLQQENNNNVTLYALFWVIPQRLNFIYQHFGTLCLFHLHEDGTVCSKTLAHKIQQPGNYPEESIQHSEHGKSLKSKII